MTHMQFELTNACSNLTMEALEKGVKYVYYKINKFYYKVNYKSTTTTLLTSEKETR